MPEDMPDRMPNRMSEDMSDRMPEDVPVRTCINVMVGITRSKVIIYYSCLLWLKLCIYVGYWESCWECTVVAFVTEATMFGSGKNRVWYLLQKWNVKNANILALTTPPSLFFVHLLIFWGNVFRNVREVLVKDVNTHPPTPWSSYASMRNVYMFRNVREVLVKDVNTYPPTHPDDHTTACATCACSVT